MPHRNLSRGGSHGALAFYSGAQRGSPKVAGTRRAAPRPLSRPRRCESSQSTTTTPPGLRAPRRRDHFAAVSREQVRPSQDHLCHVCVGHDRDHRSICAFIVPNV
jgi:hypothetical protein